MSRLKITLACWDYDRTRALADGSIQPDGIDLNYQTLEVEEIFFRMLRHREFDAAELSLSSYCMACAKTPDAFVAIPVFLSRFFRHSCIFVSSKSGITKPQDLRGRRVGVPEYQMTAPVWIRGLLQDDFGIDPAGVSYWTGGEEQPGRTEKLALELPAKFQVQRIEASQTLSQMLADGEIDALYTARAPSSFRSQPSRVRRLFPNYVDVEKEYFKRTGIFPIMHVVAVRREIYDANPWVVRSLYKAFLAAQRRAYEHLRVSAALTTMLPWQIAAVEDTEATLGDEWWPYGLERNRHALDTFVRYHHEQGLSPRVLSTDSLFARELHDEFRI